MAREKRYTKRKRVKGIAAIERPPWVMAKAMKKTKVRITQRAVERSKSREIISFAEEFFISITVAFAPAKASFLFLLKWGGFAKRKPQAFTADI